MLDAFMGLLYNFFTTLAILYGLKSVHSIYKRSWLQCSEKPMTTAGGGWRQLFNIS